MKCARSWIALALALPLLAGAAASAPTLDGIWEATLRFGPATRGLLTVVRRPGNWTASIAGRTASFQPGHDLVAFRLSDGSGAFSGRFRDGWIDGFWTQSASVDFGPYTFPVRMRRVAPDEWTAVIVPLEDRATYFLSARAQDDGSLRAFIRNPDRNAGLFLKVEHLVVTGNDVVLEGSGSQSPSIPVPVARGSFHPDSGVLSLYFPSQGHTFDFARAGDTSDFYPRSREPGRYVYHRPPRLDDGWPTDTLDDVGISRLAIERFVQMLVDLPDDSVHASNVHGVLIARHGRLVLEEYFHGYASDIAHDTRSASKSITSLLTGAAMYAGVPVSLSTPVYAALGARGAIASDARKSKITLRNLLTMSSGLECDDSNPASLGNEDTMQSQTADPDWYHFTLSLPMAREPGTRAAYCSASPNLAGDVLSAAAGEPLTILIERLLARPLGINRFYMNLAPTGVPYMGGGFRFQPRDFMKIGQVILNGGTWHGRRIVSTQWASDSIAPHYELGGIHYGYLWWVVRYPYRGSTVDAFFAGGNGGQVVMGVPKLDLLIAFYGGNYSDSVLFVPQRVFVPQYILPAVAP